MLARENMKPVNEFDLHLFDISNTKIKHDETEHLPGGLVGQNTEEKIPMTEGTLRNYAKNVYSNKFGEHNIKTMALPIAILNFGLAGGFLNTV